MYLCGGTVCAQVDFAGAIRLSAWNDIPCNSKKDYVGRTKWNCTIQECARHAVATIRIDDSSNAKTILFSSLIEAQKK